jgi:hypothetical protein
MVSEDGEIENALKALLNGRLIVRSLDNLFHQLHIKMELYFFSQNKASSFG